MTAAREYKTAKFGILDSRGVPRVCGGFKDVTAASATFGAAIPGLAMLSVGGCAIL